MTSSARGEVQRRFSRRKRITALITAVSAVLLLGACSDLSAKKTTTHGTGKGPTPAATPAKLPAGMVAIDRKFALSTPTDLGGDFPLKNPVPKGKHVCFVDNGNQYTELFRRGVQQATAALKWRLTVIQADQLRDEFGRPGTRQPAGKDDEK
jgi:hypothetical protein